MSHNDKEQLCAGWRFLSELDQNKSEPSLNI